MGRRLQDRLDRRHSLRRFHADLELDGVAVGQMVEDELGCGNVTSQRARDHRLHHPGQLLCGSVLVCGHAAAIRGPELPGRLLAHDRPTCREWLMSRRSPAFAMAQRRRLSSLVRPSGSQSRCTCLPDTGSRQRTTVRPPLNRRNFTPRCFAMAGVYFL